MYFKFKHGIIFSIIVYPLLTTQAVGRNDLAVKKFEFAIGVCEKGLQMNMPKSKGSLTILQNLFKKYQRHRDAALALEENLKNSEEERYTGSLFSKQTFLEVYQICEREFAEKLAKAEAAVADKMKNLDSQQAQASADIKMLLENTNTAKQQVVLAVDKHCASYLLKPEGGTSAPVYNDYQAAKQQALEIYPAIVNQFHTATLTDNTTGKSKNVNKTVQAWFDYCETAFTGPATPAKLATVTSDSVPVASSDEGPSPAQPEESGVTPPAEIATPSAENVGIAPYPIPEPAPTSPAETASTLPTPEPVTPPAVVEETATPLPPPTEIAMTTLPPPKIEVTPPPERSATSPQTEKNDATEDKTTAPLRNRTSPSETAAVIEENTMEANVDDEVAEYKGVMAKAQGDRLKILKEEKRLPEFVDDADFNYLKAKVWQYEKSTGDKCNIYSFKGNQLVKSTKNLSGACPPLESQE